MGWRGSYCKWVPAVDALRRMEDKGIVFTANNLRNCEQLMTPESRSELMVTLSSEKVKLQDTEKAMQTARHRMCAEFCWEAHPDIDPIKPMLSTLSFPES